MKRKPYVNIVCILTLILLVQDSSFLDLKRKARKIRRPEAMLEGPGRPDECGGHPRF